jgi:hypothetical protein
MIYYFFQAHRRFYGKVMDLLIQKQLVFYH